MVVSSESDDKILQPRRAEGSHFNKGSNTEAELRMGVEDGK